MGYTAPDDSIPRLNSQVKGNPLKIGITSGPVFFFGDVQMDTYTPGITKRLGYSFFAQQNLAPYLDISLDLFAGKVFGDIQDSIANINFRTSIFSQSLSLQYNFHPFINHGEKLPLLSPFVSVGIESIIFRPKTDLQNGDGKTYNYWADGSIRDLPETPQNADLAKVIERDYEFETELRDLDLDGIGQYPLIGLGIPLSAGLNVNVTQGFGIRLQGTYHMTFTDHIDNITADGTGVRKGESGNDNYLYTSIGLVWQITPTKAKISTKPPKDSDGDGIADIFDKCKKTEKGVEVDENGCPIIDKKPEEEYATKEELETEEGQYHWADVNKNGKIETEEVYEMIDAFLEGDSKITLQEMNDLLEYYFEQD